MRLVSFALLVMSGVWISLINISEEKEKIKRLEAAYSFACFLHREIETFKLPMDEILNKYTGNRYFEGATAESIVLIIDKLCNDNGNAAGLLQAVMESTSQDAVKGSDLLCKQLAQACEKRREDYDRLKTSKAVLPLAAGLLAGILII